ALAGQGVAEVAGRTRERRCALGTLNAHASWDFFPSQKTRVRMRECFPDIAVVAEQDASSMGYRPRSTKVHRITDYETGRVRYGEPEDGTTILISGGASRYGPGGPRDPRPTMPHSPPPAPSAPPLRRA